MSSINDYWSPTIPNSSLSVDKLHCGSFLRIASWGGKMKVFPVLLFLFALAAAASSTGDEWWRTATFYQVYPRSFKDSDGDGVGDLAGITSKMDYLASIGIDAIWLSPMFESPMVDNGYDVSDFRKIHHEFGTMDDYDAMIAKAEQVGIRVMLDFVPNHSSDQHDWFLRSVKGEKPYDEFYTWADPKYDEDGVRQPPNNWVSVFGGRAWTFNEDRQQYYLHQFYPGQPDLNYRNPLVVEEMEAILAFWLSKGAAGFRLDAINHMYEDKELRDEPVNSWAQPDTYDYLDHIYTKDLDETYDVVYRFKDFIDAYAEKHNLGPKIVMTEAYASIENTMRYYQSTDGTIEGVSMPFNFGLIYLNQDTTAHRIKQSVNEWLTYMPMTKTPNWVASSHDHSRAASRLGDDRVRTMMTLVQTLPGVSINYNGEEIGMHDYHDFEYVDSRDPNRTPMQWDASTSAGFSTNASTWLPVNPDYVRINVEAELAKEFGHLAYFKHLTALRKEPAFAKGDIIDKAYNRNVYVLLRFLMDPAENGDTTKYIVFLNYHGATERVSIGKAFATVASGRQWEQVVSSVNYLDNGRLIDSEEEFVIKPFEAVIFRSSGTQLVATLSGYLLAAWFALRFLLPG